MSVLILLDGTPTRIPEPAPLNELGHLWIQGGTWCVGCGQGDPAAPCADEEMAAENASLAEYIERYRIPEGAA